MSVTKGRVISLHCLASMGINFYLFRVDPNPRITMFMAPTKSFYTQLQLISGCRLRKLPLFPLLGRSMGQISHISLSYDRIGSGSLSSAQLSLEWVGVFCITTSPGSLFHTWPTLTVKKLFRRLSPAPLMILFLWCPLVCSLPLGIMEVTSSSYIPAMILKISIVSPLKRLNTNVGRPIFFRHSLYSRCFRPGTCFVALLCTLSNSIISVLSYGAHSVTDVLMTGCTGLVKSRRNIFWSR